jgi:uncharacterized protein YegL
MGNCNTTEENQKKQKPKTPFQRSQSYFQRIENKYETWDELQNGLRQAGLESSELIFGIDVTKSNTWNGAKSYDGKSLHHPYPLVCNNNNNNNKSPQYKPVLKYVDNPYTFIMKAIVKSLSAFDDDQMIPAYYFGDHICQNLRVQSFFSDSKKYQNGYGHGIESLLEAYHTILPDLQFSGGTSFAPLIQQALAIVQQTKKYHILVILTDGQVDDVEREKRMIAEASKYPLSICILGIGDADFSHMNLLDDVEYGRQFDNVQFVNIADVLGQQWCKHLDQSLTERQALDLATAVLMEIPQQYKIIKEIGLLMPDHILDSHAPGESF